MKNRRFKETPRDTASKGHIKIFDLIKEVFPNHNIYQEYPYSSILSKYYKSKRIPDDVHNSYYLKAGNSIFADIYDATIKHIFEIQGIQHYQPVKWSNKEHPDTALKRFEAQKAVDMLKKEIAKEAEVTLIEISYRELSKFDSKELWRKLSGTK